MQIQKCTPYNTTPNFGYRVIDTAGLDNAESRIAKSTARRFRKHIAEITITRDAGDDCIQVSGETPEEDIKIAGQLTPHNLSYALKTITVIRDKAFAQLKAF